MILNITTSDWIQIVIAVITLFGIISSLWISVKTLKQNSKMIEETTRPCIVIYKETIAINSPTEYIAIKNFGVSSAFITKLDFDKEIFNKINGDFKTNLEYLKNIMLAPGQRYLLPIVTRKSEIKNITFSIEYTNNTRIYKDIFDVNLSQDYSVAYDKTNSTPNKELITIANAIQELIKRIS